MISRPCALIQSFTQELQFDIFICAVLKLLHNSLCMCFYTIRTCICHWLYIWFAYYGQGHSVPIARHCSYYRSIETKVKCISWFRALNSLLILVSYVHFFLIQLIFHYELLFGVNSFMLLETRGGKDDPQPFLGWLGGVVVGPQPSLPPQILYLISLSKGKLATSRYPAVSAQAVARKVFVHTSSSFVTDKPPKTVTHGQCDHESNTPTTTPPLIAH